MFSFLGITCSPAQISSVANSSASSNCSLENVDTIFHLDVSKNNVTIYISNDINGNNGEINVKAHGLFVDVSNTGGIQLRFTSITCDSEALYTVRINNGTQGNVQLSVTCK